MILYITSGQKVKSGNGQLIVEVNINLCRCSLYFRCEKSKLTIQTLVRKLKLYCPDLSDVRVLVITLSQFKQMQHLTGETTLGESIIFNDTRILEI